MSFEQDDLDAWYREPTVRKSKAASLRGGFDVADATFGIAMSVVAGGISAMAAAFAFFLACAAVSLTVHFGASWGPDVVGFFVVVSAVLAAVVTASTASSMLPDNQGLFGAACAFAVPAAWLALGVPQAASWALGGLSKATASGPLSQVSGWAHDFVTTGPLSLGNPWWAVPVSAVCAVNALRHYAKTNA